MILKGFWKFDKKGAVIAYDLTLPSFGDTLDIILGNQSDPVVQAQYIQVICNRAQVNTSLFSFLSFILLFFSFSCLYTFNFAIHFHILLLLAIIALILSM